MKNQSMFPFRRNGGKKRGKGGPPHGGGGNGGGPPQRYRGGGGGNGGGGGDGRRMSGSVAEILPMLQPTTKALAQMVAGYTRSSGQVAHARNVLAQAQRLVEERAVDRLPPMYREEFLEQLARLKLTLTDAEEAGLAAEADQDAAEARPPVVELGHDRLREVALRLALSAGSGDAPTPAPPMAGAYDPDEDQEPEPEVEAVTPVPGPEFTGVRGERLRLRVADGPDAPAPVRARERLRLKPINKPATGSS